MSVLLSRNVKIDSNEIRLQGCAGGSSKIVSLSVTGQLHHLPPFFRIGKMGLYTFCKMHYSFFCCFFTQKSFFLPNNFEIWMNKWVIYNNNVTVWLRWSVFLVLLIDLNNYCQMCAGPGQMCHAQLISWSTVSRSTSSEKLFKLR